MKATRLSLGGWGTISVSALDERCVPEPVSGDAARDVAALIYTTGTTGDPKGVMLTHGNILANLTSIRAILPQDDYRLISLLPVSHMLEQTPGIFTMLDYGADVTYVPSRLPATIMESMQRRRPNMLVVVQLLLDLLMRGIEREVRAQRLLQRLGDMRLADDLADRGRELLFPVGDQHASGSLLAGQQAAAVARFRDARELHWAVSSPSLEDVFIDLMSRSQDNFR